MPTPVVLSGASAPETAADPAPQMPADDEAARGLKDALMMKSRLLPKKAQEKLHAWFNEHLSNPYPTKDEMMMLVGQAGLTETQVSNWFANARRRNKNLINLAEQSVRRLQQWFNEHLIHPYPSDDEVQRLAVECNMTPQQVASWIQQARHLNRALIRQAMEGANSQFLTPDLKGAADINAKLTPETVELLHAWLAVRGAAGLPSPEELSRLAAQTSLAPREVSNWMAAASSGTLARIAAAMPRHEFAMNAPPLQLGPYVQQQQQPPAPPPPPPAPPAAAAAGPPCVSVCTSPGLPSDAPEHNKDLK
jgi:hypothetical protein